MFSPKNRQKIRQNPAKKTTMTFVLAIVKSILATQRNDFGFNKCELKSLNNVGYCGKMRFCSTFKGITQQILRVF